MSSEYYSITNLDYVEEKPGLYAWYYHPKKNINISELEKLYKQKRLQTTAVGYLNEIYEGELTSQLNLQEFKNFDESILVQSLQNFSPPLYVGISKNLRNRLLDHRSQLHDIVFSRGYDEVSSINKNQIDTEDESKFFASRIGLLFKELESLRLKYLNIKTILLEKNVKRKDILNSEYVVNRIFNPIYGRR